MSAEATGWVFKHSPFTGASFTVHLSVADSVNDLHENEFWASQATLSKKSRVGRTATQTALRELVAGGFLSLLEDNSTAGRPNRYRFETPPADIVFYPRRRTHVVSTPGVTPESTPAHTAGTPPAHGESTKTQEENPKQPNSGAARTSRTDRMLQAALLLAQQKANEQGAQINDRAAFCRAVQRSILQEHEALWTLWLEDTPDATAQDLATAAQPVARARPDPLDGMAAAQRQRLTDYTGTAQGVDRHPAYLPTDDHD